MNGPRVLVVDDDADVRDTLAEGLRSAGYVVTTAENGLLALQKLQAEATLPKLIFVDYMMPVMDGLAFLAAQSHDSRLASIPVVMISAGMNVRQQVAAAPPAAYLDKPIHLSELLSVAKSFVGGA